MPISADGLEKFVVDSDAKPTLRFDLTPDEVMYIRGIVARTVELAPLHGFKVDMIELAMDLGAVNCNDFPIDFHAWFCSDDLTFFSEIVNLTSHIERVMGKIRPGFALKFSKRKSCSKFLL